MSLFDFLGQESLTELRLVRARGSFDLSLSRTFDEAADFRAYGRRFVTDTLVTASPRTLGDREARALVEARGLTAYLQKIESSMIAGRHEMTVLRFHRALDVRSALFVHSS